MFSRPESSWSNPAPRVSRLEIRPRTSIRPSVGSMIPASDWRSVDLPAPFGSDDRQRLAVDHVERDVAQRPELAARAVPANELGERVAKRVLPRQAQVVADPEAAHLDGGGRARGIPGRDRGPGHRTFANVGSSRLKNQTARRRKTAEAPSTLPRASQSGGVPS